MNTSASTFDLAAREYSQQLDQGISLSGESADFFVEHRVRLLATYLQTHTEIRRPRVLDFGCGIGNATEALKEQLDACEVMGLDCSSESIRLAQQRFANSAFRWTMDGSEIAPGSLDVVYTSGVFHHIEPAQRQVELSRIFRWLKPGGVLALFENNPWNPATHWVMSRIPFDHDAQCLSPWETRRRITQAGLTPQLTRSLFFFPRCLRYLRPLEPLLSPLPMGAQYVVLARRSRDLPSGN